MVDKGITLRREKGAFVRQLCPDTRLMVVDDQQLFRDAVRVATTEVCPEIEVVAEARSRRDATRLSRRTKPDVVIVSANAGEEEVLLTIRAMQRRLPTCRVLVLQETEDPAFAFRTVMAGSSGYLSRRCSAAELVIAIATARQGGLVMPRADLSSALKGLGHTNIIRLDPTVEVARR
jgi:DNA-binding NarL/FixJ family response regulator